MKNSFKIPLLSFIACVLTVGGVFGAWVFGGAGNTTSTEEDVLTNVAPGYTWEFNGVDFVFDCHDPVNYISGKFNDNQTFKKLNIQQNSGLNYETYTEFKTMYGEPVCDDPNYVFAYWGYYKEFADGSREFTHYNFDVGFTNTTTLYAQYVSVDNPAIVLEDETNGSKTIISYMFRNLNSENGAEEYMINNFTVEQNAGTGGRGTNNYAIKYGQETNGDPKYYWCEYSNPSTGLKEDRIVKGHYTVFFRPGDNSGNGWGDDWALYGEHTLFQRQYNYMLFGNPSGSWAYEDIENPISLSFESETFGTNTKQVYYHGSCIKFRTDFLKNDVVNYEFKPHDPYFDTWTDIYVDSGSTTYVNRTNNQYGNYVLTSLGQSVLLFDIKLIVDYNYDNTIKDYIPAKSTIMMFANMHTIKFFTDNTASTQIGSTERVSDGGYSNYYKKEAYVSKESDTYNSDKAMDFVIQWKSIETGSVFDGTQPITQNYNLYPVWETMTPQTYVFKTSYDNGWTSESRYVYNTANTPASDFSQYSINLNSVTSPSGYATFGGKWEEGTITTSTQNELTTNQISTGSYTGTDTVTYYPKFISNTTSTSVTIGTKTYSGTKEYIVYDNFSTNSTYYKSTTSYILGVSGANLESKTNSSSVSTGTGQQMFYVNNGTINKTKQLSLDDKVYLNPKWNNDTWDKDNARFAMYFFNNSSGANTWVNMAKGVNGYYEAAIPSGTWHGAIAVRMNGATAANNWDNKWNQTSNIDTFENRLINITGWQQSDYNCSTTITQSTPTNQTELSVFKLIDGTDTKWLGDDNAWIAAQFLVGSTIHWRNMIKIGNNYYCDIPSSVDTNTKVVFYRKALTDTLLNRTTNVYNYSATITIGKATSYTLSSMN